jgi:hypothetical protein
LHLFVVCRYTKIGTIQKKNLAGDIEVIIVFSPRHMYVVEKAQGNGRRFEELG